jgi:hypothetical protein
LKKMKSLMLEVNLYVIRTCKVHTCLKTQTVNSIPSCFSLEVVPIPKGIEIQQNIRWMY